ncbi:MAG: ABC transporter permease [Chloroflexi bacterium]|nr:ABC transporter permease [Chloroflexota bacterium]
MRLVILHEIQTTLGKRSFWVMTLLFPLVIIALTLAPQWLAGEDFFENPPAPTDIRAARMGFVDLSGLVSTAPPNIPASVLRPFSDEAAARAALANREIRGYVIIPADFLQTGELIMVGEELNIFGNVDQLILAKYLVAYNLLGDEVRAARFIAPTAQMQVRSLGPVTVESQESTAIFSLPFAVMFILFFVISFTGGYMLQSVAQEKENRTAEILLVSVPARSLMAGKVLGLGLVALLQMGVWFVGGWWALNSRAGFLNLPEADRFGREFIILIALYFLLGYLLYALALGALGALAPNAREGAQFTFLIILPLLAPFWLNFAFLQNPNGPLATALSLFPLTAPTAMPARLAAANVPLWQIAASLLGLLLATYLFLLLAARFFRADTLLSEQSLSLRRILNELRGGGKGNTELRRAP